VERAAAASTPGKNLLSCVTAMCTLNQTQALELRLFLEDGGRLHGLLVSQETLPPETFVGPAYFNRVFIEAFWLVSLHAPGPLIKICPFTRG